MSVDLSREKQAARQGFALTLLKSSCVHPLLFLLAFCRTIGRTSIASFPQAFTSPPPPFHRPLSLSQTMTSLSETPVEDVDGIIRKVAQNAGEWKTVALDQKLFLMKQILGNAVEHREEWTRLGCEARGVSLTDPQHGAARSDALVGGPATLGSYLNGMISSFERIRESGAPPSPLATRVVNGKCIATIFPDGILQSLEAVGMKGELVLSGTDAEQMTLDEVTVGGVAAVLGAGNFDAPTELLCQIFLKGRVCVYKANPVCARTSPVIQKIFEPLVSAGVLNFIAGGAEVGSAIVKHPQINEVVLTGSTATQKKVSSLTKVNISSELGSVNPWIVVPGEGWSKRLVDKHANHLAFSKMANNGHICASPQLIVVPRGWTWRTEFLDRLRYWLRHHAGSAPFYPGSDESHYFFRQHPNAELINDDSPPVFEGQQAAVFIPNATHGGEESGQNVLKREAFCPVLAELPLGFPCEDPVAFLRHAVEFVDKNAFGSLTAAVLIDDKTLKTNARVFDEILVDMPFGIVGVNIWPLYVHAMPQLRWGAYPGRPESGIGEIGNVYLFRQPEKAILRAPCNYIGRKMTTIMAPAKQDLVFSRLARYKLRPGFFSQMQLFTALFLGIGRK